MTHRHYDFFVPIVLLLLLALARVKPPITWAETHLLFSYDDGLFRRSLLGSILRLRFPTGITDADARAIGVALTLTGGLALLVYILSALRPTGRVSILGTVVATSFAMATFLGNTGYLDGAVLALGVGAIAIAGSGNVGAALATALCLLGAAIHEVMLPSFAV